MAPNATFGGDSRFICFNVCLSLAFRGMGLEVGNI